MFSTNLTGANLDGATTTGAQRCQMTQPDGSFVIGSVEDAQGREVPCIGGPAETPTTTAAGASGPPRVEFFRQANPKRCITDVAGEGIDIEWSTPNATSLTFYVDGIRIESATKTHGVKRVPFRCDGRVHIVSVQAFGPTPPSASALFTATLDATAPLTSDD
jgi:hypothetical protein